MDLVLAIIVTDVEILSTVVFPQITKWLVLRHYTLFLSYALKTVLHSKLLGIPAMT